MEIRFLVAEFMPQPPPTEPRARQVFEWALRQRLAALRQADWVLFVCATDEIYPALRPIVREATRAGAMHTITNPHPTKTPPARPFDWGGAWQRMTMTDRWARLLNVMNSPYEASALILPAHDAIYTRDLLLKLYAFSQQHARNGLPAAVSPYTFYQHSPVPGVDLPPAIIDLHNAAFNRDPAFRLRIESGAAQGFWGKLSVLPLPLFHALRGHVDSGIWEDDLEIDRAINARGYAARAAWIDDPRAYRHALPVFTEADARRVIERHLHYSLRTGGSHLTQPLTDMARYQRVIDPRFGAAGERADRIIAEEYAKLTRRVEQFGASWVDWGAYRHVARPYDPHVEVWKKVES